MTSCRKHFKSKSFHVWFLGVYFFCCIPLYVSVFLHSSPINPIALPLNKRICERPCREDWIRLTFNGVCTMPILPPGCFDEESYMLSVVRKQRKFSQAMGGPPCDWRRFWWRSEGFEMAKRCQKLAWSSLVYFAKEYWWLSVYYVEMSQISSILKPSDKCPTPTKMFHVFIIPKKVYHVLHFLLTHLFVGLKESLQQIARISLRRSSWKIPHYIKWVSWLLFLCLGCFFWLF